MIKEISLFLEDKPLQLANALDVLSDVNIWAFSIDESGHFSIIRVLVDLPEKAKELLSAKAFGFEIHDVFAVVLPHKPGALARLSKLLGEENININYGYLTVFEGTDAAIVIIRTDKKEETARILKANEILSLDRLPIPNSELGA